MSNEYSQAKILIIEDDSDYLQRILERLKRKDYQSIDTANNLHDAKQKLLQPYDVIVADMRLGEEQEGGFKIIDEIQQKNITSIVIILTANDSIKDCRKALQHGGLCWDYISKSMTEGSALDELHLSIQKGLATRKNSFDNQWIEDNKTTLLEQYPEKYIAVINHQVVTNAETSEQLRENLKQLGLPLFVTVIAKITAQSPHNLPISEIIKLGESNGKLFVEFKSTLSWCTRDNKRNDDLRFEVLKTIAAFLNSGNGTLLIGVEDNGNIYGLEKDFDLCKNKNSDGFELKLRDFIINFIGIAFSGYITIYFETIEEKPVCKVDVLKSPEPAFLKEKDAKKFYVRDGNRSKSLDMEEMYRYLKIHNT